MISEEIYPYIVVYNNIFEDPQRMYDIVKNIDSNEVGLFENWQEWYTFGKKVEDFGIKFDNFLSELKITSDGEPINKKQEDQKYFITELVKGFLLVNQDYIKRYNVDFDTNKTIQTKNPLGSPIDYKTSFPEEVNLWKWTGPSLCKYFKNEDENETLSMSYHSDYQREPIITPGYKFAITTTTYINDDYIGGDLDFIVQNKLIGYKPKMGDFIVFPSGHPEILTENEKVYLHGVKKVSDGEKYLTRMYWEKFNVGDDEWFVNEERYGRDQWLEMQDSIMTEYRESVSIKNLDGLVRIR